MSCSRAARITLFDVVSAPDGGTLGAVIDDFCPVHLHEVRDRLRSEGRRTGVSIVTAEPPPTCGARMLWDLSDPFPAPEPGTPHHTAGGGPSKPDPQ